MAGNGPHAQASGTRDITVLALHTQHVENMKTCGASFVNAIEDGDSLAPKCEYNAESTSVYEDRFWGIDLGKGLGPWYGA